MSNFTNLLTTDIGKVRLLLPDTDPLNFIFRDDELQVFLDMNSGSLWNAVACAYETLARDSVRRFKLLKEGDESTERFSAKEMMELADRAREADLRGGVKTGNIIAGHDHLDTYRPLWKTRYDITIQ